MSSKYTYIFNTGGVEWTAAELDAVLTNGECICEITYADDEWNRKYNGDKAGTIEVQTYSDGDGWEGWGELTYGVRYVRIDGVDHKIIVVDDDLGCEGHGENTHLVFRLEGIDRFFKVEGTYYSYDGSYWENPLFEVRPTNKVITVYEAGTAYAYNASSF
jgi:hypothetical protein